MSEDQLQDEAAVPMVTFDHVSKRYGDLVVLDNLCLSVAANEKVAIIGPSGSGKTTVLRLLMTLERINDGVIYVDGQPLTHEHQRWRVSARQSRPLKAYARLHWHGVSAFQPVSSHDRATELHAGTGHGARIVSR